MHSATRTRTAPTRPHAPVLARACALACACLLALACLPAPPHAQAADNPGAPATPSTPEPAIPLADLGALELAVEVSASGDAALAEGAPWGLTGAYRAQAGSNRPVNGTYHGYNYYAGAAPNNVSVVVTNAYAVAYVPHAAAQGLSVDLNDPRDLQVLAATLVALDAANAKGSATLGSVATWYVTSEQQFDVGAARFLFDQELAPGRYYTCVIGTDGLDVTAASHPQRVEPTHALFAQLTDAAGVVITQEATGLEWLARFLANIDYSPLWVTLKTTGCAVAIVFVLGLAAAYLTLHVSTRTQDVLDSVFTIPMVLPPTVCGFVLLLALGNNTALGRWFIEAGLPLVFSWPATVIAATVVAFPLMYRSARGAFEALDPNMLDAARTLGWSEARVFGGLMLPLAWPSIAAGTVLAFARALGEFGATLFLAGNYLGVTRTIPIAIYFEWMNGNTDVAIFWTLVIMAFSFAVVLFINLWSRRTSRYRLRGAA